MVRKRFNVSREGRVQIIYGMINTLDVAGVGVTMTQLARAMGMKPSSYIMTLLWELWREHDIEYNVTELKNGSFVRSWRISRPGEQRDA